MLRVFAFALGVVLAPAAPAWDDSAPPGGQAVPALKARVTDQTGTLSSAQRGDLEGRLAGWESQTGIQLAVLIVPTTQPESIEQFSIRVAEAWKLGKKGQDNGALLLIAKNDKKMRLEVGYGLEGNLPDVSARRTLNDTLGPHFRGGRYYEGLVAGIDKIYHVAAGDEKLTATPSNEPPPTPVQDFRWLAHGVEALIAILLIGAMLRALFGRVLGAGAGGAAAAAAGWFLTGSLAIAGIAAVLVLLILLSGVGRGGRGGDGWMGGWGGGYGGGSGGGGGDSWSGGGGSFGGGGASASWGDSDSGGGDSGGGDGGGGGGD